MTLNGVMTVAMHYFTEFVSSLSALRISGRRYADTSGGRIFIAIFVKVTENRCIMHIWQPVACDRLPSLQYYLLITTFKFNSKSDFTMMKLL